MNTLAPLPNYPVIVQHLKDQYGLAACCGHPIREVDVMYDKVPRYLCPLCVKPVYDDD